MAEGLRWGSLGDTCTWKATAPVGSGKGWCHIHELVISHWLNPCENKNLYTIDVCVLVTQSCPPVCDPMDSNPPRFSVHGILQRRILEWVAIPFFKTLLILCIKQISNENLHRELYSMLCGNLSGKKSKKERIYIYNTAHSFWCMVETDTTV